MLGRTHRFHGHNTLTAVYRRGETLRGQQMTLKFSSRAGDKPYRVAVVVSKKVSKSAVVRNRIRRRIYEIVRLNESLIPAGTDLLFTVFGEHLAEIEALKLKQNVVELLKKAAGNRSQTAESHVIVEAEGKTV